MPPNDTPEPAPPPPEATQPPAGMPTLASPAPAPQKKLPDPWERFRRVIYQRFGLSGLIMIAVLVLLRSNWSTVKELPGVSIIRTWFSQASLTKGGPAAICGGARAPRAWPNWIIPWSRLRALDSAQPISRRPHCWGCSHACDQQGGWRFPAATSLVLGG
jgi:hypothetical protein